MPDDYDRFRPPHGDNSDEPEIDDEAVLDDSDIPFDLPRAENAGTFRSNIYKDETDELIIPDDPFGEDPTIPNDTDDDIAKLHASDPPLADGPPEDNTMVQRARQAGTGNEPTDDLDMTVPHEIHQDDEDVPFHLPKHGSDEDGEPIGSKFVTMPSKARSHDDMTLPGSGGLDPNPDFSNIETTMPNLRASQQQTAPARHQSYQRPGVQQVAPPMQRDLPPAPQQKAGKARGGPRPLPKKRGRLRRMNPGCMILVVMLLTFCGGLTFVTLIAGAFAYVRVGDLLNDRLEVVENYQALQSNTILDRNGDELFTVFSEQGMRINIDLEALPKHVIDATLAIEDDSFYSHIGIDIPATTVALMQYIGASQDDDTPGGSTITQQLVRNVLFDPEYRAERSAKRKAEEILLAVGLEARRSKDDILELYLNEIYYGNLAYGIEAAAQTIFEKSATELTIGEAALLAGLPNIPAFLDPLSDDPEIEAAVEERRRTVLSQMLRDGDITEAQYTAALNERMRFGDGNINLSAPHFTVHALAELDEILRAQLRLTDEQIGRGGLNVLTTVDLGINDMARQVAADQIAQLQGNNASNAAVVVLNPGTGEILGMVGSVDYYNEAIDGNVNVTTRPRQPGSTMKAFTYSAAIERGLSSGDVIWDTPVSIGIPGQPMYTPRNYDGAFHGPMRVRSALANSYNIPAVQTLRYVGVDYLLDFMQRFGVESLGTDASRYGLSLTLGGGEITLLELARGYAVFANEGQLIETTSILCIWDNANRILYEYGGNCPAGKQRTPQTISHNPQGVSVLDPRIAFVISDILADNRARTPAMGSNSPLYTPDILTSVKTGTTDDVKDNWTVGFTRNVVVGVWVGNNNGDPMVGVSGLAGAGPIWNQVITNIYNTPIYRNELASGGQLRSDQRIPPNGISLTRLCDVATLTDPALGCSGTVNEWLLDSPAGQYAGNGTIVYPPGGQQSQQRSQVGSYVEEVEPGVYRTAVFPLNPAIANAIQFNLGPGDRQPPPPLYCRVPVELVATTPGVQEQLFIAPPPVQADAAAAEEWARQRNLAFLPTIDCSPELLVAGGGSGPIILTAYITAPSPGQTLPAYTELAIVGTAQFTSDQAAFYKVDLIGGEITEWRTIGPVHYESVVNGQLDVLPALPPGDYRLSLEIVGLNGNLVQPGFEVPFSVR